MQEWSKNVASRGKSFKYAAFLRVMTKSAVLAVFYAVLALKRVKKVRFFAGHDKKCCFCCFLGCFGIKKGRKSEVFCGSSKKVLFLLFLRCFRSVSRVPKVGKTHFILLYQGRFCERNLRFYKGIVAFLPKFINTQKVPFLINLINVQEWSKNVASRGKSFKYAAFLRVIIN